MALAPDVAELEVGVVVAGVLVVDDEDGPAVVDEIGGQQVVVARPGVTGPDPQGVPDARRFRRGRGSPAAGGSRAARTRPR